MIFIIDEVILLNCSTVSGPNPNASCIFPFKFNGMTHRQCIKFDKSSPSCSTLVDDSGKHVGGAGNWGYCEPDCYLDLPGK